MHRKFSNQLINWRALVILRLATFMALVTVSLIAVPFWVQGVTGLLQYQRVSAINQSNWPQRPVNFKRLHAAQQYNAQLASHEQVIGEPLQDGKPVGDFTGSGDTAYQQALNDGAGLMGTMSISSINVSLPIYHGSDPATLSHGAGHLHGTSLPVGGPSTHAVLTAHRGYNEHAMLLRLGELKPGDMLRIDTEGETLWYTLDKLEVVKPTQTQSLHIEPGKDLVTLVTCTPINVNTDRLLAHFVRASTGKPRVHTPHVPYENIVSSSAFGFFGASTLMLMTWKPQVFVKAKHRRA